MCAGIEEEGVNMTSRELIMSTLEFRNTEGRVPRQL